MRLIAGMEDGHVPTLASSVGQPDPPYQIERKRWPPSQKGGCSKSWAFGSHDFRADVVFEGTT